MVLCFVYLLWILSNILISFIGQICKTSIGIVMFSYVRYIDSEQKSINCLKLYSHFISKMTLLDKGGNMWPLLA